MDYILITGAPNTGKSETIYSIGKCLISDFGFIDISHAFAIPIPKQLRNCLCILEGKNRKGYIKRILINTPAHDLYHINQLFDFYQKNKNIDLIITTTRDGVDQIYKLFFEKMQINPTKDSVFEIPLAKITRRTNSDEAFNWYKNAIKKLILDIMKNTAFEL